MIPLCLTLPQLNSREIPTLFPILRVLYHCALLQLPFESQDFCFSSGLFLFLERDKQKFKSSPRSPPSCSSSPISSSSWTVCLLDM